MARGEKTDGMELIGRVSGIVTVRTLRPGGFGWVSIHEDDGAAVGCTRDFVLLPQLCQDDQLQPREDRQTRHRSPEGQVLTAPADIAKRHLLNSANFRTGDTEAGEEHDVKLTVAEP